jgi:ribonuclease P protein component
MLKEKNRLRSNLDFQNIYKYGKIVKTKYFILRYLQRPDQNEIRIGFAPARKTGCRVLKNRAKRRVREIFRHNLGQFSGGYDLVLNISPGAIEAKQDRLTADMLQLFRKAGVLEQLQEND